MNESIPAASIPATAAARKAKPWQRLLPFLITAACFAYLYERLSRGAAAEGSPSASLSPQKFRERQLASLAGHDDSVLLPLSPAR